MAMSKKHYTAIADVLNKWHAHYGPDNHETEVIDLIGTDLSEVFAADNPNFDRERFMAAVTQRRK
jgi:hypothetical protein